MCVAFGFGVILMRFVIPSSHIPWKTFAGSVQNTPAAKANMIINLEIINSPISYCSMNEYVLRVTSSISLLYCESRFELSGCSSCSALFQDVSG